MASRSQGNKTTYNEIRFETAEIKEKREGLNEFIK